MLCPYCQHPETKVIDSRDVSESTRRRRECEKCEKRFTTYEKTEIIDLYVIKRSGAKEGFSREKLKASFIKACNKTPVAEEQINSAVEKIEQQLMKKGTINIPSQLIGEMAIKSLKKLDSVAYLRYASVFRGFSGIKDFKKEIKNL